MQIDGRSPTQRPHAQSDRPLDKVDRPLPAPSALPALESRDRSKARLSLDGLRAVCAALAYLVGGWLDLLSPAFPPYVSLFSPAAGIALAALACWGPRMAWGLVPAAFCLALLQGAQPGLAALIAGGSLAGPLLAILLMRQLGFRTSLSRRRDLTLFLLLGVLLGPLVSAAIETTALEWLGQLQNTNWARALWYGWGADAVGVLTVASALISLHNGRRAVRERSNFSPQRSWRGNSLMEPISTGLLLAATFISAGILFYKHTGDAHLLSPWMFAPHLLICGLSLRSRDAAASIAALLLALLSAMATSSGLGPFGRAAPLQSLVLLWSYVASAAVMPLLIHALVGQLHDDRRRWLGALEAAGLGVAEWHLAPMEQPQDSACFASPTWTRFTGASAAQSTQPMDWLQAAHPLDKDRATTVLQALLLPGDHDHGCESLRLMNSSGDWCWYELKAHVQERSAQGQALRLLATLSDVSWQRTAEERQRMSVSLFQHLHEGLLVTDTEHRVLDANPSYCRMMGVTREALIGELAAPLQVQSLLRSGLNPEQLQLQLQSQGFWQAQVQTERMNGVACTLQLTVSSIPEPDGPLRYQVVSVSDLTQTLRQQATLERQARFDTLTRLPNHDEFTQRLRQGLTSAERGGFRLSICRVDLDHFKRVNAQYGAEVADALLQQVAERLQASLRSAAQWSDVVARLSGDEFALLLRSSDAEEAQLAIERLLKVLSEPYLIQSTSSPTPTLTAAAPVARALEITASIGATLFPQDNSDAETLLRHAGHALYSVKHTGRNGFQFFDTAQRLRDEASLIALARVHQALDAGELRLHYQPKINMRTAQVLGMEALLRWQHPERGLLAPAYFLPLIEPTGLGVQVGDWVIEQALKQSAQWLSAGLHLNISVNVTARQLQMPDFTQRLQELIARHGEPVAEHLTLEVLESAALADIAATNALIQRCRAFGISFALDDFGTGYSTFTYLKQLPVDALKIDRSFVQHMLTDAQDSALVEGVIGLARTFECSVVAEGVESPAHARALLSLGCHEGQGNGIALPMPALEVQSWVAAFAHSSWLKQISADGAVVIAK